MAETTPKEKSFFSLFLILMWKNFLVRKRHWVLTIFEILLPTLLFFLLVLIRILPESAFLPTVINTTTTFEVTNEETLRAIFCNDFIGNYTEKFGCIYAPAATFGDRKFIYGPSNDFTDKIMEGLKDDLNIYKRDIQNVSTIEEMDDAVDALYLGLDNDKILGYFVGIFFHLDDPESGDIPTELKYDLRMQKVWFTDLTFPYFQIPGPRNYTGDYTNAGSYAAGGFSLLQTLIDRHYTALVADDPQVLDMFELQTQMYPYPPYVQDNGMSQFYGAGLPTFVVISLVLLSPTLIKSIVHEKETGVRELMKLMGMDGTLIWIGWFCHGFFVIIIIVSIMVFFLKIEIYTENADGLLPPILIYSDGFLLWIILLLYGISSIAFCFAVSCLFSKPTLATTMGILIWLLSYFIPQGIMNSQYDSLGLAPKILISFLPNMAINWVFRVAAMFEGRAVGVQWDNLWETGNPRDELTMGMLMIMLVADTVLFLLITWYVDKVMPGTYGVPLKWNFFLKSSYWSKKKPGGTSSSSTKTKMEMNSENNFEEEPSDLNPGIVITNLRKEFPALGGGIKVAVSDVSLKCYEGQCTVLLGHNGAGKTTTMSVITGIYSSTGGTASISGYDIHSNMDQARAQVGLCPQHNTLFADLNVEQHLIFFAMLKGKSRKEAKEETETLLSALQLTEKKDQFGDQLSGGMKRKLCLCIALVGDSKVVILDEPSSGLDPESRRWVWDTIQKERSKRTVLVTTHHMEEADVLGDRIAIMAAGTVVCTGSTLFLKSRFGDGYSLRVLPKKGCSVPILTSCIQSIVPGAALTSTAQEELVYRLSDDKTRFAILLEELTVKKELLKITHVGLSLTSMEQVFLRVGEQYDPAVTEAVRQEMEEPSREKIELASQSKENNGHGNHSDEAKLFGSQFRIEGRLTGFSLLMERLKSLWVKRIIYSKRKFVLLITQGLVPVLTTLLCLMVDLLFFGDSVLQPRRDLNLTMFDSTVSYVEMEDTEEAEGLGMAYRDQFWGKYEVFEKPNVTSTLIDIGIEDEFHYRENYVTSAVFGKPLDIVKIGTRMLYQSIPYHAPGVGINLMDNAILQYITQNMTEAYKISTANYPLPYDQRYRFEDGQTSGSAITYALTMPLALAFLSSSFLVFPLQERESKAKQVQIMTGTSPNALWFTSFTWDLLTYTVSALLVFILFMAVDPNGNFTQPTGPGALFLMLFLYGFGAIPLAYLFSFGFKNAASGFGILTLFNIVAGMIIPVAVIGLKASEQPGLLTFSYVLGNFTSFVPSYPVSVGFKNFVDTSTYNTQCDIINDEYVESLCNAMENSLQYNVYYKCCPKCKDNLVGFPCFEPQSYYSWDGTGLGKQFLWLFAVGLLYIIILLLIEAGVGSYLSKAYYSVKLSICKIKMLSVYQVPADDDVIEEARKAKEMMKSNDPGAALVVEGLKKDFNTVGLRAVDDVSFSVNKGECFGLLGVNGAGKTTTFRMLTGDEEPTSGDARIGKQYLSDGKRHFVKEIGYCPQFDAILDELTGEETLNLLAGLRGVPKSQRQSMMADFVKLVDLTECYKRQTRTYSGGNKRKLSTAMALVGSPPLVFLDEPTTGVDPASRRRVWMAIRTARANGQSIILTSHSMDECEALCNKIVILVRGQLRCAGTPGHLKAKFSQGHSLQIKLKPSSSEEVFNNCLRNLQTSVSQRLAGAQLTDQHKGMLNYLVPSGITWSDMFTVMEDIKSNPDCNVEDYAATEPSLEQVFLAFAREADLGQADEDELVTVL